MISFSRLYRQPYFLLPLSALFWGGNAVAGRLAVGEVSPFTVVFLRWLIVSLIVVIFWRRRIAAAIRDCPLPWRRLFLMSVFGYTGFNTLFYLAAERTPAINIGIIQGVIPILVLLGAFVVHHSAPRFWQIIGALITVGGVAVMSVQGDFANLLALRFNIGDAFMLLAVLFYAGYTVSLKNKPPMDGVIFFSLLALLALLASLPLAVLEMSSPDYSPPTAGGGLIVLYIALLPSFLAQIFFIRGVELIGPARAGVFVNLVPVFSVLLAVAVLSETFHWFQALALCLVSLGIFLCEYVNKRAR